MGFSQQDQIFVEASKLIRQLEFYINHVSGAPPLNRHLIVVEGFEYPNDPRSYVVWGLMPLVGSPKANRSQVTGQTKSISSVHDDEYKNKDAHVTRNGVTGAPPWGWGSQVSPKNDVGLPSSRFTTRRRVQKGLVPCDLGGGHGRGPR